MASTVALLRHGKERLYGTLMSAVGVVVWPLVAIGIVAAFESPNVWVLLAKLAPFSVYIVAFLLYVVFGHLFLRAYMLGHYVMVGPEQFPELGELLAQQAGELGLVSVPTAFVRNSSGVMNAMAVRLVGRRYVWLNSALLDADTDAQLRFIVGHELGHHALGHLDRWRNLLRFPGRFVPLLGPAYSRARELSCDRVGAYLARDLAAATSALQMLACGSRRLNTLMNPRAFAAQERLVPPVTGFILHAFSGYPRLTRRVQAVGEFHQQGGAAGSSAERAEPLFSTLAPGTAA